MEKKMEMTISTKEKMEKMEKMMDTLNPRKVKMEKKIEMTILRKKKRRR
jgi:hypothetical protein